MQLTNKRGHFANLKKINFLSPSFLGLFSLPKLKMKKDIKYEWVWLFMEI